MELSIIIQCSKCGLELQARKLLQRTVVIEVEPCEHCEAIKKRNAENIKEKKGIES